MAGAIWLGSGSTRGGEQAMSPHHAPVLVVGIAARTEAAV